MIRVDGEPIARGVTKPVTKSPRVTKGFYPTLADLNAIIARGRPRKHPTAAERQKVYRARKAAKKAAQ